VTSCYDDTNGKAVINGEVIDKAQAGAPGTCIQFASGGSLCTMPAGATLAANGLTSPPSPSADGTAVDTPVAVVSTPGASGGGIKAAYFSAAQNAASANPVTGTSAGSPSQGSGTGSGPSAANGDCGAAGVDCAADGTLPSLERSDTIQSNVQTYIDAIKSAPLINGLSGLASAFPDASCPSLTVEVYGKTADFMPAACTTWAAYIAGPLSYIFLAIWAVFGIRVIMSA
jgi:hypothetical protein